MYEKRDCTKIIYPHNSIMYVNFSDDIYWTNDIFKQYYANRKVEDIKLNLNSFEKLFELCRKCRRNSEAGARLLRENNTWITTLDQNGNLKHADDFYFEVTINRWQQKRFGQQIFKIPYTISSI